MADGDPAYCPSCGTGVIDFQFAVPLGEIAAVTYDGVWHSMAPFPVLIFCLQCEYRRSGQGHGFSIDPENGVILHGRITHD